MKFNRLQIRMFDHEGQIIAFSEYSTDLILNPEGEYTFTDIKRLMTYYVKLMDERNAEGARVYCMDGDRMGYMYWDNDEKTLSAWSYVKDEGNNPTECHIYNMMTGKYEEGIIYDEVMKNMSVVFNDERHYLGDYKVWCEDPEDEPENYIYSRFRVYVGNGLIVSQDYNTLKEEVDLWKEMINS